MGSRRGLRLSKFPSCFLDSVGWLTSYPIHEFNERIMMLSNDYPDSLFIHDTNPLQDKTSIDILGFSEGALSRDLQIVLDFGRVSSSQA